jgi:hypothetical protein
MNSTVSISVDDGGGIEFRNPATEFDVAIATERLSADPDSPIWAGHYMYMGRTTEKEAMFKHSRTRQYL